MTHLDGHHFHFIQRKKNLHLLESFIADGFTLKDRIENEYNELFELRGQSGVHSGEQKWVKMGADWADSVLNALRNVFETSELHSFKDAQPEDQWLKQNWFMCQSTLATIVVRLSILGKMKKRLGFPWKEILLYGSALATIIGLPLAFYFNATTSSVGSNVSDPKDSVVNLNSTIETQNINFMNSPDSSFENVRSSELDQLSDAELIENWFQLINNGEWLDACSLFAKDKCDVNDGDSVSDHIYEAKFKTVDGYNLEDVYHSNDAPSNIWCVKYSYQEKQSTVPRLITLMMQYTLVNRTDGMQEIGSRLCEKKWAEGLGERECTAPPSIYYCRD